MALEALRFTKNWTNGTRTSESNWDEIANNFSSFALRTNNNLKQLGLDINAATYDYNNVGKSTQTTAIIPRIAALEVGVSIVGTRNIGLDTSTVSKVKLVGADASNLTSTNIGYAIINSSTTAGVVVTRNITANIEVTLTGAHWGLDTFGDKTAYVLWIALVDDGSSTPILAVTAQGGRETITAANSFTAAGSVTSRAHWLTNTAVGSTYNVTWVGWITADFDDTGNPGGENYWSVNTGTGAANIGRHQTYFEGTVVF